MSNEGQPKSGERYGCGGNQAKAAERGAAREPEVCGSRRNAGNYSQKLACVEWRLGKSEMLCGEDGWNAENDVGAESDEQNS